MNINEFGKEFFSGLKKLDHINNINGDSLYFYLSIFSEEKNVLIARDEDEALKIYNILSQIFDNNIHLFNEWDKLFFDNTLPQEYVECERIHVLNSIQKQKSFFLIATLKSYLSAIISKKTLNSNIFNLSVGQSINLDNISEKLINIGYSRVENVEKAGEFAIRGEVVDIWINPLSNPNRIECGFDEIELIREFDADSNLNLKETESKTIDILPFREVIFDLGSIKSEYIGEDITKEDLYNCYPDIYSERCFLHDYVQNGNLFIIEEENLKNHYDYLWDEYSSFKNKNINIFSDIELLKKNNLKKRFISNIIHYGEKGDAQIMSVPDFNKDISELAEFIHTYMAKSYSIIFFFPDRARFLRMRDILKEYSIDLKEESEYIFGKKEVFSWIVSLDKGFMVEDEKILFIGEDNIWGSSSIKKSKKVKRRKRKNLFDIFTELDEGDYVVHVNHGIGIYRGIKKVRVGVVQKEFFNIEYAGSDELFVPIECADFIHKYVGQEKPPIYSLDGKRWGNLKKKVKKKVKDIAKELINLYSERMQAKGYSFNSDTEWQYEMEASFPYEETEDQKKVLEDIKSDMESESPMDRLVCGDVGYGKTELAIRAAFKAVMSGKQVAVLAPTTILAEQHYRTFSERYRMFPVKVDCISRMKTPAQNRDIINSLKDGELDVIIGTHKLLSAKVNFKELGLLIVDEEQRFGVSHKEKIKKLKNNIDVLTMTATPIPRTLNMALNGIRDISVIETAPDNRMPIKTYVVPFSENVVKEAILREIEREGQVYYLYNNVATIEVVRRRLEELLPTVRFRTAHGQMGRKDLNEIMDDFLHKKFDVLITTTIIESGIDIPNVNTIVVENAHRFGLSQLYQLKGRVGRSQRQAYAYLFYKKDQVLSKNALKRLKTLRENTELGSGFKIAMKDLEIRGSGNVFGKSQHGFVDEIGFEMYCKVLKEVVAEEKGEAIENKREINFRLPLNAFIPDFFENSRKKKIALYKKISETDNEIEYELLMTELKDKYKRIPEEVLNLLKLQLIKINGRKIGLKEISEYDSSNIVLKFYDLSFSEKGLGDFINRFSDIINLTIHIKDCIVIKKKSKDYLPVLELIQKILQYLKFCVNIGN